MTYDDVDAMAAALRARGLSERESQLLVARARPDDAHGYLQARGWSDDAIDDALKPIDVDAVSDAWREHHALNGFVPDSVYDFVTGAVQATGWSGSSHDGQDWITRRTATWLRELADLVRSADLDAGDCANVWCLMRCDPSRVLAVLKRHGDLREFGATDSELDATLNPALALADSGLSA